MTCSLRLMASPEKIKWRAFKVSEQTTGSRQAHKAPLHGDISAGVAGCPSYKACCNLDGHLPDRGKEARIITERKSLRDISLAPNEIHGKSCNPS